MLLMDLTFKNGYFEKKCVLQICVQKCKFIFKSKRHQNGAIAVFIPTLTSSTVKSTLEKSGGFFFGVSLSKYPTGLWVIEKKCVVVLMTCFVTRFRLLKVPSGSGLDLPVRSVEGGRGST